LQTQRQQSIVIHLQDRYQIVVEKLLRFGTRRRYYYEMGLKAIRIILKEGLRNFWMKYREYRSPKQPMRIKVEPSLLKMITEDREDKIDIINNTVSIIIPTKNAGKEFNITLERIRNQKGVKVISIVVVDSGSVDGTIQSAKNYHAEVYTIEPGEFNHGLTRNFGAAHTTGDYLLFMVQDAIPIGEYWLFEILNKFQSDKEIAGINCRQIPRSDADLYSCYILWSHNIFMDFNKDKITQISKENFMNLSGIDKRRFAGVENVCFCIKKDIFDNFKFNKMDYAEDIDLGIRLIENGYKIGFLYSSGVIHSHKRGSNYFLKRNYVNNKSLNVMFDFAPSMIEPDIDLALSEIFSIYNSINYAVDLLSSKYIKDACISTFFVDLKEYLIKYALDLKIHGNRGDDGLDFLFLKFEKICDRKTITNNLLLDKFLIVLDSLRNYAESIAQTYEVSELFEAIYKLFASWSGWYLGDLYSLKPTDEKMQKIDRLLKEGI
jgi:GT2 family glycosyltransferase